MDVASLKPRIRVLVVDDSVLMGIQISKILSADGAIEVLGRAKDGQEALQMVERLRPDVITLDVEMPRMDGITALKHIMVRFPTPTIMVSSLTREGAKATFDSLRFGALDVIPKPSRRETESLEAQAEDIVTRVKRAAAIGVRQTPYKKRASKDPLLTSAQPRPADSNTRVICIGSGSGGYSSLLQILPELKPDFRHVVVAMIGVGPRNIEPFVTYMEAHSSVRVRSVYDVTYLERGVCYVGSSHDGVALSRTTRGLTRLTLHPGSATEPARGSVDTLFRSLAQVSGPGAVGVVMSGAGKDGADGLMAIRKAGGVAIAQAPSGCMNPGMPGEAIRKGAVDRILPDHLIAEYITRLVAAPVGQAARPIARVASGTGRG